MSEPYQVGDKDIYSEKMGLFSLYTTQWIFNNMKILSISLAGIHIGLGTDIKED